MSCTIFKKSLVEKNPLKTLDDAKNMQIWFARKVVRPVNKETKLQKWRK